MVKLRLYHSLVGRAKQGKESEEGEKRRGGPPDPPTQRQRGTPGGGGLQHHSPVVVGVSYSVVVQEVLVEDGHLFAVQRPSPPWWSAGDTAEGNVDARSSRLLQGHSDSVLDSSLLFDNVDTATVLCVLNTCRHLDRHAWSGL